MWSTQAPTMSPSCRHTWHDEAHIIPQFGCQVAVYTCLDKLSFGSLLPCHHMSNCHQLIWCSVCRPMLDYRRTALYGHWEIMQPCCVNCMLNIWLGLKEAPDKLQVSIAPSQWHCGFSPIKIDSDLCESGGPGGSVFVYCQQW